MKNKHIGGDVMEDIKKWEKESPTFRISVEFEKWWTKKYKQRKYYAVNMKYKKKCREAFLAGWGEKIETGALKCL
jgi:hypothetical protein